MTPLPSSERWSCVASAACHSRQFGLTSWRGLPSDGGGTTDETRLTTDRWKAPRRAPAQAGHAICKNQMERAMRLTSTQVERTLSQFEAQPIPDNDPVIPRLSGLFGDHTFFLDDNG